MFLLCFLKNWKEKFVELSKVFNVITTDKTLIA